MPDIGAPRNGQGFKPQQKLKNLKRSRLQSSVKAGVAAATARQTERVFLHLRDFLRDLPFIAGLLRHVLDWRHPFLTYKHTRGDRGVYEFAEDSTMAIAGDWGTGTAEANQVGLLMCPQESPPDYTIHLGDVYYVGAREEVRENCLGKNTCKNFGVTWPVGKAGSFALNGNHEMYAGGDGYFHVFLKHLGLRMPDGRMSRQKASYFCLQNKYWKIIGLDTAYNSYGPWLSSLPLLKRIQWLRRTPRFKPSCALPNEHLEWLDQVVQPENGSQAIILLSHHEYFSAFDDWYVIPAKQIAERIHRNVLWFWGHEHRLAFYGLYGLKGGLQAWGRCVGHGGMPVDVREKPFIKGCHLLAYDKRVNRSASAKGVGYNGFCRLKLEGPSLQVEYVDLTGAVLALERWKAGASGEVEWGGFESLDSKALTVVDKNLLSTFER